MKLRIVGGVVALVLGLSAGLSRAETVTLQANYAGFIGLKNGLSGYDGSPESTLNVSFDGQGPSTFIGSYNWIVQPGSTTFPDAGQSLYTFCIEKSQTFNVFDPYTYTVNPILEGNPLGGPDQGVITPAGALQLQGLIDAHWSEALFSDVNAAAFQLAVWEIEYDAGGRTGPGTDALDLTAQPSSYYFGNGRLEASADANSTGASALALATDWLNNLSAADAASTALVFNSATNQDHLIAVPVPTAVSAGGVMMVLLFVVRRLRRRY